MEMVRLLVKVPPCAIFVPAQCVGYLTVVASIVARTRSRKPYDNNIEAQRVADLSACLLHAMSTQQCDGPVTACQAQKV